MRPEKAMTEKINGPGFRPADAAGARRTEAAKPAAAASPVTKREGAADTVQLTASALLLGKLEEAIRALPVVDSDRVAALREAVDSGAYEIDARSVADGLVRFERELGR